MNTHDLHTLAKFLRKVPERKFNLMDWVHIKEGFEGEVTGEILRTSCGTTACAVGWCSAVPEFQAKGFRLVASSSDDIPIPRWKGHENWRAVEEFFQLVPCEASHLFSPDYYKQVLDEETGHERCAATPSDVADRIDEMTNMDSTQPDRQRKLLLL